MKQQFGFNRDLWILRRKNALLVGGTAAVLSMMGRESLFVLTVSFFMLKMSGFQTAEKILYV